MSEQEEQKPTDNEVTIGDRIHGSYQRAAKGAVDGIAYGASTGFALGEGVVDTTKYLDPTFYAKKATEAVIGEGFISKTVGFCGDASRTVIGWVAGGVTGIVGGAAGAVVSPITTTVGAFQGLKNGTIENEMEALRNEYKDKVPDLVPTQVGVKQRNKEEELALA